jgi:hypothetical protein
VYDTGGFKGGNLAADELIDLYAGFFSSIAGFIGGVNNLNII